MKVSQKETNGISFFFLFNWYRNCYFLKKNCQTKEIILYFSVMRKLKNSTMKFSLLDNNTPLIPGMSRVFNIMGKKRSNLFSPQVSFLFLGFLKKKKSPFLRRLRRHPLRHCDVTLVKLIGQKFSWINTHNDVTPNIRHLDADIAHLSSKLHILIQAQVRIIWIQTG